jgi:RNA polymerase sigma factor (sigma-70 family)
MNPLGKTEESIHSAVDAPEARAYADAFPDLVRMLVRLVGDRAAAEDLAQEAGLRLIRTARSEAVLEPRAFLFHAAANLARDHLRRRVTRAAGLEEIEYRQETADGGADQVAAMREELALVGRAVADLPRQARTVLLMARVEGMSHKQIAQKLGIAPKTVENHLGRALAMLARALGTRGRT